VGLSPLSLVLVPALSMIVAMAVYTSERWGQLPHAQIQTFFSWSFYLGWVSVVLFLGAGNCPDRLPRWGGGWLRETLMGAG
jgi:hypothetical protein